MSTCGGGEEVVATYAMAAAAVAQAHAVAMAVAALLITWVLRHLVWRPYAVARRFERQGIRGPPYRVAVGSLPECKQMVSAARARGGLDAGCHDYASLVYPFFHKWTSRYGKTFLFWLGPLPAICSSDMEFIKQVLADRTDLFQKAYLNPSLEVILGKGVLVANGDDWRRQRKVVNPIFHHDKLKNVSAMVAEGTRQMMERWCGGGEEEEAEVDMRQSSSELTLGIIAQVIFGDDHREASCRELVAAVQELQALAMFAFLDPPIPGFWYLPTRRNRRARQLDSVVTAKMTQLVEARLAGGVYGDDLLGLTLEAWSNGAGTLSIQEVIGECKTFFAAGQESTANHLTWTMFLLGRYPAWQDKVREEVLRECPDGVPGVDTLGKLKLLNMCLLEALRLYNPLPFLIRRTSRDAMVASVEVPEGTMITIPVAMMHRDEDVWGADADEFNPARFENGASKAAKHPNALLAFSYGPRACSAQSFAMIEVQTAMVTILRSFSFSVSPAYVHKPSFFVTLVPRYGVPLVVRKLQHDHHGGVMAGEAGYHIGAPIN